MMQSEATIYLADKRGCTQSPEFRSLHVFNFGEYFNPNRKPPGRLKALNDETLRSGSSKGWVVEENTLITLIPLVGNIHVRMPDDVTQFVEAGQVLSFFAGAGERFVISNPFLDELVNFIQVWSSGSPAMRNTSARLPIGLDIHLNTMLPICINLQHDQPKLSAYIGKYSGRQEDIFPVQHPPDGVFVFVIDGAFEVEGRLVQSRDGLALRNLPSVEFEALSDGAIILVLC